MCSLLKKIGMQLTRQLWLTWGPQNVVLSEFDEEQIEELLSSTYLIKVEEDIVWNCSESLKNELW